MNLWKKVINLIFILIFFNKKRKIMIQTIIFIYDHTFIYYNDNIYTYM